MKRRRSARPLRLLALSLSTASLVAVAGCNEHSLKPVEYVSFSSPPVDINVNPLRDVDILFVIDNSGSMAEEQATLAANFGAFIEKLEANDVAANYRIAVTTTDNGHGGCGSSGPEAGNFVLSSCRSRLGQFQSAPGSLNPVDARAEACEDICPAALADLTTTETETSVDTRSIPRPWMENIVGNINLPDGVDTASAFACLGPQGIDGCGFESPLETMRLAFARAQNEGEDEFGFLRDDALLAVVFVTDEADCSLRNGTGELFDPLGERDLWTDDSVNHPTSGICWSAGVICDEGPGGAQECYAADIGPTGNPVDPVDAVLHPLDEYVDVLRAIEKRKRELTGNQDLQVLVSLVAGVPSGYSGGEVGYGKGADLGFTEEFGVDPGCESSAGKAVPPVRLLEFANEFRGEENNVFSVCDDDYTDALEELAHELRAQFKPACEQKCLRDDDPASLGHQNDCVFSQVDPDGTETSIGDCERTDAGWVLPEGVDVCVYVAVDDERDPVCIADGAPVEFRPLYRVGVPRTPGARLGATCSVSTDAATDCPWDSQ